MHQFLRGYTTAVLAEAARGGRGEQIAEDLNAIAHLVSRTNDLALALTDFAVPAPARKAVLQDLLEPRVDAVALRVVLRAVDTETGRGVPHGAARAVRARPPHADLPAESLQASSPS